MRYSCAAAWLQSFNMDMLGCSTHSSACSDCVLGLQMRQKMSSGCPYACGTFASATGELYLKSCMASTWTSKGERKWQLLAGLVRALDTRKNHIRVCDTRCGGRAACGSFESLND